MMETRTAVGEHSGGRSQPVTYKQRLTELHCPALMLYMHTDAHIHSLDGAKCTVITTNSSFGNCAFTAAGPWHWNSLPTHVHQPDLTTDCFRWKVKAYLFVRGTSQHLVTVAFRCCVYTILLTYMHAQFRRTSNRSRRQANRRLPLPWQACMLTRTHRWIDNPKHNACGSIYMIGESIKMVPLYSCV